MTSTNHFRGRTLAGRPTRPLAPRSRGSLSHVNLFAHPQVFVSWDFHATWFSVAADVSQRSDYVPRKTATNWILLGQTDQGNQWQLTIFWRLTPALLRATLNTTINGHNASSQKTDTAYVGQAAPYTSLSLAWPNAFTTTTGHVIITLPDTYFA